MPAWAASDARRFAHSRSHGRPAGAGGGVGVRCTPYARRTTHDASRDTSDQRRGTSDAYWWHAFVWKKARKRDFALDKTSGANTLRANSDAHSYCVQTVRVLTGYEAWMLCGCLEQGLFSPLISKRLACPADARIGRNPSDSWVAQTHSWRLSQRCASKPAFRSRSRCMVPAARSPGNRPRPVVSATGGNRRGPQSGMSRPS